SKSLIRVTQYGRVWPSWQAISGQTWAGTGHALRRLALAPRVLGVGQRVRLPAAPAGLATTAVPVVGRVGAAGLELARLPGLAPVLGDRARVRLAAGLTGVGGVGGLDVAGGDQLLPATDVPLVRGRRAAGLEPVRHQAAGPPHSARRAAAAWASCSVPASRWARYTSINSSSLLARGIAAIPGSGSTSATGIGTTSGSPSRWQASR